MTDHRVGIDIEQFMRDPYATGIQRVLQYLAREWPADVDAHFVVPVPEVDDAFVLLRPTEAAALLSLPFEFDGDRAHLKMTVDEWVNSYPGTIHSSGQLHEAFNAWLLPEVSYLPSVVSRFEEFRAHARSSMVGYDVLPMIEPANYRFPPGRAAWVSEYFRMLAGANAVACISEYSMRGIVDRLRRPNSATTVVAHPGGDHISVRQGRPPQRPSFIRVGTMEARKLPVEILEAFIQAIDEGLQADLVYVGSASASDVAINERITSAIDRGYPVRWIQGATDDQVHDLIQRSSAFLSFGVEGYGIPVLESIRVGTPVLFGGEQPAAQLMQGRGSLDVGHAHPIPSDFHRDFDSLVAELRPNAVPVWSAFASMVAGIAVGA